MTGVLRLDNLRSMKSARVKTAGTLVGLEGSHRLLELPGNCLEAIIGAVLDPASRKDVAKAVRACKCKCFRSAWKGFLSSPNSADSIVAWAASQQKSSSQQKDKQGVMSRLIRMGAACNPSVLSSLAASGQTDTKDPNSMLTR